MLRPLAAVLGRFRNGAPPAATPRDSLRDTVKDLQRTLKRLEEAQRTAPQRLETALAEIDRRLETLSHDVRGMAQSLSTLQLKESQLRAVLAREAELAHKEPALASLMDRDAVRDSVAASLSRAELRLAPFPHAVVDRMLPDALYDALVDGLPPAELFADRPVNKRQMNVPFGLAPRYARRVWGFMADVVVPDIITPAVVDKFRAPLTAWLEQDWPDISREPLRSQLQLHGTRGRILLRTRGYEIAPHRDPKWGFITCLMYLARPEDSESWGTQLYQVREDPEARNASPHWIDATLCSPVREVAFRRNRVLIFLNSTGAHGAMIPSDALPEDLERYSYQFRIKPTGDSMNALLAALSEPRRPIWADRGGAY
jgi:hypothetical protein